MTLPLAIHGIQLCDQRPEVSRDSLEADARVMEEIVRQGSVFPFRAMALRTTGPAFKQRQPTAFVITEPRLALGRPIRVEAARSMRK